MWRPVVPTGLEFERKTFKPINFAIAYHRGFTCHEYCVSSLVFLAIRVAVSTVAGACIGRSGRLCATVLRQLLPC